MRGPIDYIIVGFKENKFDGSILKELKKATEDSTIAVLAVSLISKDKDGNVTVAEFSDPDAKAAISELGVDSSLIQEDDVEEVGELLENNTSAGLLIVEQLWAKDLKKAILDASGFLIAEGRIHPDASKELDEQGGK